MRNRLHCSNSHKRVYNSNSHNNQQVTPLDAYPIVGRSISGAPMIQTMQPHAFHNNDLQKTRRDASRGDHVQHTGSRILPQHGSLLSESAASGSGDEGCINTTLTKTIPLPEYHIPKTQSELQLQDDMVAAELRDYCMFRRLVEGMQKRCSDTKKHCHKTNHCQPQPHQPQMGTSQGGPAVLKNQARDRSTSKSHVRSVPEHEEAGADDYGHFVIDDHEMTEQQGLSVMGCHTSDKLQTAQTSFAFPNLAHSDQQSPSHVSAFAQKHKEDAPKTKHIEPSFEEDDADDSIFVLDL